MPENSEKIYQDEQIGPVRLCKSARARRITVRVHPIKGVSVTVPRWMPYAAGIVFFRSRRDWVLAVLERQRSQGVPRESLSEEEIEAMRAQAKRELPPRLAELAACIRERRGIGLDALCRETGRTYGEVAADTGILAADGFICMDLLQNCTIKPKNM